MSFPRRMLKSRVDAYGYVRGDTLSSGGNGPPGAADIHPLVLILRALDRIEDFLDAQAVREGGSGARPGVDAVEPVTEKADRRWNEWVNGQVIDLRDAAPHQLIRDGD